VNASDDGWSGDVTVAGEDGVLRTAAAVLGARFDPLAGSLVWSGRVAADLPLRARVEIATPHGAGAAETTERDVWATPGSPVSDGHRSRSSCWTGRRTSRPAAR
jgi:hypothetical protein